MHRSKLLRRLIGISGSAGLLLTAGCFAAWERGADLLLSPEASGNILRVPFSALRGLFEFLLRLVH